MGTFEDILAQRGTLIYRTQGVSMLPMLHQNRDIVIISVPVSRLKKYDVALYKRGQAYILHRVIEVREKGYLIRGDNTYALEDVPDENVIGVLTGFIRKKKQHDVKDRSYQCYVRFWQAIYPLRALLFRFRRLAVSCARKLGILPALRKMRGKC